jgi:hypothetical protein
VVIILVDLFWILTLPCLNEAIGSFLALHTYRIFISMFFKIHEMKYVEGKIVGCYTTLKILDFLMFFDA